MAKRKVDKSAYSKERRRIMNYINRQLKKDVVIDVGYIPTLRQLREQGVKGSALSAETRKLKKQLATKELKKRAQERYQWIGDDKIDITTGEIVDYVEHVTDTLDGYGEYSDWEDTVRYIEGMDLSDTDSYEPLEEPEPLEESEPLEEPELTDEYPDAIQLDEDTLYVPTGNDEGYIVDVNTGETFDVQGTDLLSAGMIENFRFSYKGYNGPLIPLFDRWLDELIDAQGKVAVAKMLKDATDNGLVWQAQYGYNAEELKKYMTSLTDYLPMGEYTKDAIIDALAEIGW